MSRVTDGRDRMRELAGQVPDHLRHGFRTGHLLGVTIAPETRQIAVVGMGGSAISGDLLINLADAETERAVVVVRSPELPQPIDNRWLVVCASYSGDTWETLGGYAEAGRRGSQRVVISSGGKLSEKAADDEVPCLVVPPGLPPRAAIGYMFGGLLGLTDPIFPESNEHRLESALERMDARRARMASASGGPATLASRIGTRAPFVYAESGFSGVAHRWKTQVEENAKRLTQYDLLPELFHNALVPWDAMTRAEANRRAVVLLEWVRQDPRSTRRFRYLERLLKQRGVRVGRVALTETDRLAAILSGVWWGDYFSLALAEQARIDPLEVDAIGTMKQSLSGK